MEPIAIFGIAGCILSAAIVYVVLKVRHFGESQLITDQVLSAQTEAAAIKKKLLGYTRYGECLEAGRKALVEQLKPPVAKVVREYVHVAHVPKELFKLNADAIAIVTYSVEFSFSMDLSATGLEVLQAANGVILKISRPSLLNDPVIKNLSHKMVSTTTFANEKPILVDVDAKFAVLAKRYGLAMCMEEGLRAICKMKALEVLRDALAKQSGVQHLPAIFVDFK